MLYLFRKFGRHDGACRFRSGVSLLLGAAMFFQAAAQSGDLAAGKLLVASERITDPDFSKTVVLLVHFDDQGAIGLILNRPLKERPDGLYSGGPLALQTYAVLRSRTPPPDSIRLLENVYVTVNRKFVEEMASARARPASVRIYHGSIGWTERQLRNEVAAHFWRVFPGDAGTVFDAHVDSMWTRLRKQ